MTFQKPERDEWGNGLDAMLGALQLEKNVNAALLELHSIASKHNDVQVSSSASRRRFFTAFAEAGIDSSVTVLGSFKIRFFSSFNR